MEKRMWKIGLVILIAGIMTVGYGGWCKKKDHDDVVSGSSAPAGWPKTSNPSTGCDIPYSIIIGGNYLYIAGFDESPSPGTGDYQWRIEKRNKSDGALASGFGTGGVVVTNPGTGEDQSNSITADDTYLYIAGDDESLGVDNLQWRIQKRNKSNGALVAGFGTGGEVVSNLSTGADDACSITADADYLYVAGGDESPGDCQWRIEKRYKSDGALVAGFGTGGVVTNNPSASWDEASFITADATYLYIAGNDGSPGVDDKQWRIEKRNKSDGALVAGFGTGGVVLSNPSADSEYPHAITVDDTYLYIAGGDKSPGTDDYQWRIEKRNKSDGALVGGFGTGGVVVTNLSSREDQASSIIVDANYLYIAGVDGSPGVDNWQWRIEKRNKNNGALVSGFGTGGVVVINPSTRRESAYSITADATYLYIAGGDESPGVNNWQWRIEKRLKTTGGQ